jgi:hypothetical protein
MTVNKPVKEVLIGALRPQPSATLGDVPGQQILFAIRINNF